MTDTDISINTDADTDMVLADIDMIKTDTDISVSVSANIYIGQSLLPTKMKNHHWLSQLGDGGWDSELLLIYPGA